MSNARNSIKHAFEKLFNMMTDPTRCDTPIGLFPSNNDYVAVAVSAVQNKENDPNQYGARYTYHYKTETTNPNGYRTRSTGFWTDHLYQPHVLANGLFFHSAGNWRCQGWQNPAYIVSLLPNSHTCGIDDTIDPSLVMTILDSPQNVQLACVSKERKELLAYNAIYSDVTYRWIDGPNESGHDHELLNKKGICIFSLAGKDETISSIATFSNAEKKWIAIGLNTGEIKLGPIHEDKFVEEKSLTGFASNPGTTEMQLLSSSSEGILIAYDGKKCLRVWDKAYQTHDFYNFPQLTHLSVSASGKYLSAMADFGSDKSNTIYIIPLNKLHNEGIKVHVIKLDTPISHFVIGKDDKICIMDHENSLAFPGTVQEYLVNYYQKIANEAKAELKEIVPVSPPQQRISAICGLFGKNKSPAEDNQSQQRKPSRCVIM